MHRIFFQVITVQSRKRIACFKVYFRGLVLVAELLRIFLAKKTPAGRGLVFLQQVLQIKSKGTGIYFGVQTGEKCHRIFILFNL